MLILLSSSYTPLTDCLAERGMHLSELFYFLLAHLCFLKSKFSQVPESISENPV